MYLSMPIQSPVTHFKESSNPNNKTNMRSLSLNKQDQFTHVTLHKHHYVYLHHDSWAHNILWAKSHTHSCYLAQTPLWYMILAFEMKPEYGLIGYKSSLVQFLNFNLQKPLSISLLWRAQNTNKGSPNPQKISKQSILDLLSFLGNRFRKSLIT